jgi:ABC-2 type transport system ATP-binding protein
MVTRITAFPTRSPALATHTPAATLTNVGRDYGNHTALDGLNYQIQPGQIVALLGPNGAGKTTTVNLILGLLRPTRGQVRVFGTDPQHHRTRARIGAMPQTSALPFAVRVSELVELFSSYYPNPLPLKETLERAGLTGLEQRRAGALSGGQQQRIRFALALCGNPDLLVLDEPTVGLDAELRQHFWTAVRDLSDQGRAVLVTTHYLEEVEALAHEVAVMNHGRIIAQGTPQDIKNRIGEQVIRCRTTLPESAITSLDGVKRVNVMPDALEIVADHASSDLLPRLYQLDPAIAVLEVRQSSLEEAFLNLTKEVIQ